MKFSVLLKYVTPHRNTLVAIMALLLVQSAVSLATPWLAGQLTGAVLGEPDAMFNSIRQILVVWLVVMTVRSLLGFATKYLIGTTGATMAARLRTRVYQHLQMLPISYSQERKQGDMLTLLSKQ